MPIYEYRCDQGHVTESFRHMSERKAPVRCKECGGTAVLIISQVGRPKFMGVGFYENDYVNPKAPWRALGDEPPEQVDDYREIDRGQ